MLYFVPQFKEVVVCDKRVSRQNRSKTVRRVKPALTDGTNGRQRWQNVRGLVRLRVNSFSHMCYMPQNKGTTT